MLWEHEPQMSVSTAFSSSPKLAKNTEYMFSISFRKHCSEKKENNLLTFIIKMFILFARTITTSTARTSSVSSSSYTNMIINQSTRMLS